MTAHPDLPNDADGEAIRRVLANGSSWDRPMLVDFHIAAPDRESARAIMSAAQGLGYAATASQDEGEAEWTTTCSIEMILSYEAVLARQLELDTLAKPHGGYIDGWGTFGNA